MNASILIAEQWTIYYTDPWWSKNVQTMSAMQLRILKGNIWFKRSKGMEEEKLKMEAYV